MSAPRLTLGLVLVLALLAPGASQSLAQPAASPVAPASPAAPGAMLIVENAGQWPEAARFQVWNSPLGAGTTWLAEDAIWIVVPSGKSQVAGRKWQVAGPEAPAYPPADLPPATLHALKLTFPGSNPDVRIEPFDPVDTTVSYFLGNDPAQWRSDVPVWSGVRYVDLYPGIDLELTHENGRTVLRVATRPGANLAALHVRVEGADAVAVDGDHLRLSTAAGEHALPLLQATGYHNEATVQARGPQVFDVSAPFAAPSPASYSAPATPDSPADDPNDLLYGTYLGGSGGEYGKAIVVDGMGNAYVTGGTGSDDFPTTPGAFDPSRSGGDAFVAKLNAAGSALDYATFLGGSHFDDGYAIAVDGVGSAYVTGTTRSDNFPTTPGAFDTSFNSGMYDAFLVKLNPSGSALTYATFLGGSYGDSGSAIVTDNAGSTYVTGSTSSSDFPITPGASDTSFNGYEDAFVVKMNPTGSTLAHATFLGGSRTDRGYAIAVDGAGSSYVAGYTEAGDFPATSGAFDPGLSGYGDAFVAKLNSTGSALAYATFLGGSSYDDHAHAIAVDGAGGAYVMGYTNASDFPTTPGAFDPSFNGWHTDAFVAKLNPAGSTLSYSTFLGGWEDELGYGLALDEMGSVYVTGMTGSDNFPTTPGAFDTSLHSGSSEGFLVKLNPSGSALDYGTFLGGGVPGYAIAVDEADSAYVTGSTGGGFPTTPGAFDPSHNGTWDAFVAKLNTETEPGDQPIWLPIVVRQR